MPTMQLNYPTHPPITRILRPHPQTTCASRPCAHADHCCHLHLCLQKNLFSHLSPRNIAVDINTTVHKHIVKANLSEMSRSGGQGTIIVNISFFFFFFCAATPPRAMRRAWVSPSKKSLTKGKRGIEAVCAPLSACGQSLSGNCSWVVACREAPALIFKGALSRACLSHCPQ